LLDCLYSFPTGLRPEIHGPILALSRLEYSCVVHLGPQPTVHHCSYKGCPKSKNTCKKHYWTCVPGQMSNIYPPECFRQRRVSEKLEEMVKPRHAGTVSLLVVAPRPGPLVTQRRPIQSTEKEREQTIGSRVRVSSHWHEI
jgi:hypothetical protein